MRALIYDGPSQKHLGQRDAPRIVDVGDAIVRMTQTTICGTDLHILKRDVLSCAPGRILGHEGVGVIETVGAAVANFKPGDHVLISITTCGRCDYCRRGIYSHCVSGVECGGIASMARRLNMSASLMPTPASIGYRPERTRRHSSC